MSKFNELINSSATPVLVDFYADWCQPCHILAPIIKEVANDFGESLKVIKVDVDRNPKAAAKYKIRGIPTLILFYKGKILWQHSGVMQKAQLIQQIKQTINSKK